MYAILRQEERLGHVLLVLVFDLAKLGGDGCGGVYRWCAGLAIGSEASLLSQIGIVAGWRGFLRSASAD